MFARVAPIVLLVGVWFLAHPEPSYACLCIDPGPSPAEGYAGSTSVFMGRVVSVSEFDPGGGAWSWDWGGRKVESTRDPTTIEFDVSTVWKGRAYETMYLTTYRDSAGCGFRFVEGVTYVVYSEDGLSTYLCDRTRRLSDATEDLEYLGQGHTPSLGTAAPTPDLSERQSAGCGLSPRATDLSTVGLMAGIAWLALRRRSSGQS